MALLVLKFGGTSMADHDRIRAAARKVAAERARGHQIVVVVSAKAKVTDALVNEARALAAQPDPRELDAVLSTGESLTAPLLALALQAQGIPARSLQGWQLPIHTTPSHTRARIDHINTDRVKHALAAGEVVVITGFQGITRDGRISTLGRGGSDTSAVALAAALRAERCDIYTDVNGVYTADPRLVPRARKVPRLSFEEMLELASAGAKVLHTRSVELAMKFRVPTQVLSSFEDPVGSDRPGTLLTEEDAMMEDQLVSGITYSRDDAKITLQDIPDKPGMAASLFGLLAEAEINVDMIVQSATSDGQLTDLTFSVPRGDHARALELVQKNVGTLQFLKLQSSATVSKISVVGVGMRSHAGVAQVMFRTLADKGINIHAISTSEIKVSVLIDEDYTELALRALHAAYGLDAA